jgi:DNA-binding winged helix-turn-helix (wHTH) protein
VRVRFGRFTIDSDTRQLSRDDREVHLSPKAFDLLCLLIHHRPNVLQKDELHTQIWRDSHVSDASLAVLIGELREAVDDDAKRPRFIRTAHGVGYAFCGEAIDDHEPRVDARTVVCWLTWKGTTFPLADGDNVIGRDPRCTVWLDVPGVSRRHAKIHIDHARRHVTLEDLDSTNGTFVRGSRVASPVALENDDLIKIGSVDLRLRLWTTDDGPKTKRIRRPHRE